MKKITKEIMGSKMKVVIGPGNRKSVTLRGVDNTLNIADSKLTYPTNNPSSSENNQSEQSLQFRR